VNQVRLREHKVKLTNQNIIELAYLFRDYIEEIGGIGVKLDFERTNCNRNVLGLLGRLMGRVDDEYREIHGGVCGWVRTKANEL